jgi:predicted RNase H-like HicB family nuclease
VTHARFTAVFERHGRWFVGYVPEVPGVNAQERTLVAARRSLAAALQELAKLDPASLRGRGRRIEQIRGAPQRVRRRALIAHLEA